MKKNLMKKLLAISAALLCSLALTLTATGCADANGLHNVQSSEVTFVFKNFTAAPDGEYTLPGDYNNWDNTAAQITLKDGEGTSTKTYTVSSTYIKFTLVSVGSWTRSWYPTIKGNADDSGKMQNFDYSGLSMGTDVTITVDGSTGTAVVTAE